GRSLSGFLPIDVARHHDHPARNYSPRRTGPSQADAGPKGGPRERRCRLSLASAACRVLGIRREGSMAETSGERPAILAPLSRLISELIKALAWPVFGVLVLFAFWSPLHR